MSDMSKKYLLPIIALMSISACSNNNAVTSSISPNQSLSNDPVFIDHRITEPNKTFNRAHQTLNEEYISSLKAFSQDFYKAINSADNAVFSPLSIATCYSMLYDGALEETKAQLKAMLHYNDNFNHYEEIQKMLLNTAINDEENGTYLDLAQSLWIHNKFIDRINQDYFEKMQNYYFAEAYQGVLESEEMHQMLADYINAKTNGFLDVDKDTFKDYEGILWLLNTIYLKAKWVEAFPKENDRTKKFNNIDGTGNAKVDFMNNTFYSSYYKTDNYMISSLPYYHGLTMTILLPNEGTDYAKVLNDESAISAMVEYYNTRNHMPATIAYSIPKFKVQKSYELDEVLPELGVELCFDDDKANLFGLVQDGAAKGNLYVERSKHEAGIEVNNDGTEAAAYTIIEVDEKAVAGPEPGEVKFVCDHPFAYIINTSDGLPLFMGTVNTL